MKSSLIALALILAGCGPMAEMIQNPGQPTVRTASTTDASIDQAQLEAYNGPKARVAVSQFIDKTAKGGGAGYGVPWYSPQIGNGMADMLGDGLLQSNRFIVLDRQALGDVIREQDLGGSGRVRRDTAASIGEIEGADLLVKGAITEFQPGSAGAGGGLGLGCFSWWQCAVTAGGAIVGSVQQSYVAMIVQVVDAKTSRILFSTTVEGKANDFNIGGLLGTFGGGFGGIAGLGQWQKTPVEKAIRVAILQAVKELSTKTPQTYFRHGGEAGSAIPKPVKAQEQASSPIVQPVRNESARVSSNRALGPVLPSSLKIKASVANLRDAPGTHGKVLATLRAGLKLSVQGEEKDWYFVQAENGNSGWISKSLTTSTQDTY